MNNFGLTPVNTPTPPSNLKQEIVVRDSSEMTSYRGRPRVWKSMFLCGKCHKEPQEIGHYTAAATTGRGELGEVTREEGYLHGYARCHGEVCEFMAPFALAWAAIDSGQKIVVFDSIEEVLPGPEGAGPNGGAVRSYELGE